MIIEKGNIVFIKGVGAAALDNVIANCSCEATGDGVVVADTDALECANNEGVCAIAAAIARKFRNYTGLVYLT